MTKRHPLYFILGLLTLCLTAACNDDDDTGTYSIVEGDFNNCAISSFSLANNDKILRSLDSVFFSIDLVKAQIFNADSLPKGTDISRFIVNVSAPAASKIELSFKSRFTLNDTTVNLTENPADSINFANGPVKMTVTSYNGQVKRDYTINVNVHTIEADTLYWGGMQQVPFPKDATAQRTVRYADKLYTLLAGTDGSNYLCTTDNPDANTWTTATAPLPAGADLATFSATDNALYIASADGALYTSADALTWTAVDATIHCVYGGYGPTLLGARREADGTWRHVTYPPTAERPVPAGCPVSGTSQLIIYHTIWSADDLAIMIGGKDTKGSYTGECWAYDGSRWDRISTTGIDERQGVTLFPYFTPQVDADSWRVTEQSALIAMGGQYETAEGIVASNKVYISYDFGITWKEADSYLQFPKDFPAFSSAQAYVINTTLHARSLPDTASWTPIAMRGKPCWAMAVTPDRSRVSRPVTEWECPYIYLYGGVKADGRLLGRVARGVINRFTFKPLY